VCRAVREAWLQNAARFWMVLSLQSVPRLPRVTPTRNEERFGTNLHHWSIFYMGFPSSVTFSGIFQLLKRSSACFESTYLQDTPVPSQHTISIRNLTPAISYDWKSDCIQELP
jgi:hypothetical protein